MTDQNNEPNPSSEPPKIKLGQSVNGEELTAPTMPGTKGMPPKGMSKLSKSDTSKLMTTPIKMTPTGPVVEDESELLKRTTMRITSAIEDDSNMSDSDKMEVLKKSTVRVQIEETKKGDTQRLAQQAEQARSMADERKKTSRIDLSEVLQGEESDIFKRRTALLDASKFGTPTTSTAGMGPKTIRIKQPETPPTSMLKKSTTNVMSETVMQTASIPDMQQSKKSETARIDLPPEVGEQPPTRRKTIRIKRPEGAGTVRTMVVARAQESGVTETTAPGTVATNKDTEESYHPLFMVAASLTLIVTLVLLYVLSSQSIAANLPFPGKIL